jgi:hypothetical protein
VLKKNLNRRVKTLLFCKESPIIITVSLRKGITESITLGIKEADMNSMKQCPYCAELVRDEARICKHCFTDFQETAKEKKGKFMKLRLKAGDKTYAGDVFVPDYLNRVSDVINDKKPFIVLVNAVEETRAIDVPVGFIALNKTLIESIRLSDEKQIEEEPEFVARMSCFDADTPRRVGRM